MGPFAPAPAADAAPRAADAAGAAGEVVDGAEAEEAEFWIDQRGRGGGPDADRLAPQLTPEEQVGEAGVGRGLRCGHVLLAWRSSALLG